MTPARAHGVPLPVADIKTQLEDFRVEEILSFEPSGAGPHYLLRVEKSGANTRWVAAQLARLAGVPVNDVGYAGLKDRHAITVQWFSVPAAAKPLEFWTAFRSAEFKVLEVQANLRKLKRGALSGNRFQIRLRGVAWSREQLELKLVALRTHGAPNYFGPQRFGREGYNLSRVATWMQNGQAPNGRAERSFALSAGRSLIFNALLARRVEAGDWSVLSVGDLANLDGSASHFSVTEVDEELQRRLREFDVHPTGPLWGGGELRTAGQALIHELSVANSFKSVGDLLVAEGLMQERRALRCRVLDLSSRADAGTLTLSFTLGRGQFATAVLRELCELRSMPELESDGDE